MVEGLEGPDGADGHAPVAEGLGSVLCFLPGWDEIKQVVAKLESSPALKGKALILPLHSSLTQEEQQLIFEPAPPGKIKIIVSTNIAESSVTISDAIAIVDSGKVKELQYDSRSGMSVRSLFFPWQLDCALGGLAIISTRGTLCSIAPDNTTAIISTRGALCSIAPDNTTGVLLAGLL